MPNSNDRNNGNNQNNQNNHKPRTSGGIRFAGRRLRDIEREAVLRTLELNGNNQSAAARSLCISRPTLARKLNSYRADDGDQSCNSGDASS
jgi:DNA-binding NtrC family response regulator